MQDYTKKNHVNDANGLQRLRRSLVLLDHTGKRKLDEIYQSLKGADFVEGNMAEGKLTTRERPLNVFARIGAGSMPQPEVKEVGWLGLDEENKKLEGYSSKFMVACNRPENDINWNKDTSNWVGKASMSVRHRFMILKDLSWWNFNVAVLGLRLDEEGKMQEEELDKAIKMLEEMIAAAKQYVSKSNEWSYHSFETVKEKEDSIGLYFHAYPNSSVNSLHMHIVDIGTDSQGASCCGPTFHWLSFKNLPADQALQVLRNEKLALHPKAFLETYDLLREKICASKSVTMNKSVTMDAAAINKGIIPRETDKGETLLILAMEFLGDSPGPAERKEVHELIAELLQACPVEYLNTFINAQAATGRTALQECLASAHSFNEKHADAFTNTEQKRAEPDLEILNLLIAYGADLLLRDKEKKSALAYAVSNDLQVASRVLFARLTPLLVDVQHAIPIAASLYLDFEPFELFSNFIREFPQRPGASLLGLVRLATSTSSAALAMRSSSAEVMLKYELVAESCSKVIVALLQTLDSNQLNTLFTNTRAGTEFLHSACSGGTNLMDHALASEQVFVTIDKRWDGALLRLINKWHTEEGDQVPLWKVTILFFFFVGFCVPMNLFLLPAVVAYEPLHAIILDAIRKRALSLQSEHIQFFKQEPISLEVEWQATYLLQTPQFAFYIYIAAQLAWIFAFSQLPPDPSPGVAFGIFVWSLLAAVAELNEIYRYYTKWKSDWVNWIELPGLLVGFIAATNAFFGGSVAFTTNARAVFSCMLFMAQGLRVLQIERQIGPLVLMLKSMLVDAFLWSMLVSVTLLSFAIGLNEALKHSIEHPELDSCNAATFAESYTYHLPRMIVSMLGGGEEYITCFSEVDDSQTAAVLMTVFLGLTTIILINMLIAIMSKTFDSIFQDSENNFKVQRVRLFVAYADNVAWPAPLNLLSVPYWLYTISPSLKQDEKDTLKGLTVRPLTWLLESLRPLHAYKRCVPEADKFESSLADRKREDIDSIVPALNDNESSNFQIFHWQKSIDENYEVHRAILPRKTLKWINSLYRLEDNMSRGHRGQLQPELLVGLRDKSSEGSNKELDKRTINKYRVYCTLGKFVKAHLAGVFAAKASQHRCSASSSSRCSDEADDAPSQSAAAAASTTPTPRPSSSFPPASTTLTSPHAPHG